MIMSQGGAPDMRQEPSTKWTALILRVVTGEARIHVQCFCTGPMPLNDLWKCTYSMLCTAATLYRDLIWWEWAEDDAKAGEKETKVLYGVNLLRWLPIITSGFGRGADQLAELPRFEPLAGHNEGTLIVRQMHDEDTIIGIQQVETW